MTKLEASIEKRFINWLVEKRLRELEPSLRTRLNDQTRALAHLQLLEPQRPLFGNVEIEVTIYRHPGEDEEVAGCDVDLRRVSVSTVDIEQSTTSRIWVGHWWSARAPRDIVRSTYSIALEPLDKSVLRQVLSEDIAALEALESMRSAKESAVLAAQRQRNEYQRLLNSLDAGP